MAEILPTLDNSKGVSSRYSFQLVADADFASFWGIENARNFALHIWDMPTDTIQVFWTLFDIDDDKWVELTNCNSANPVVANSINIDNISMYKAIKVVKTGTADTVDCRLFLSR